MIERTGGRLLLVGSCLLLLKLTGCPGPQPRPDPQPVGPSSTGPNATTPGPLPSDPAPPTGVSAKDQCPLDAAGRTCYVTQTDDGTTPPAAHPCQHAQVGQCDPGGQPQCLFRWKLDGEACNNNLGVCQNHRCRCTNDRSCGYDCSQTCEAKSACQQGVCIAQPTPDPGACGGCAHRAC